MARSGSLWRVGVLFLGRLTPGGVALVFIGGGAGGVEQRRVGQPVGASSAFRRLNAAVSCADHGQVLESLSTLRRA